MFSQLSRVFIFFIISFCNVYSQDQKPISYLDQKDEVIYDMKLSYKEYYGSGILILKKSDSLNYHGAFISKLGLGILEFEIVEGEFTWIKILKYLDKKLIKKVLEKDFSLLMLTDLDRGKVKIKNSDEEGVKYKVKGKYSYKLKVNNNKYLYLRESGFCVLARTKISYSYNDDESIVPTSIELRHNMVDSLMKLDIYK
ncbi:hypothetical protein OO013_15950 [Mangrovivirga sp. M17]|uniref:Uncharacterized protein n=1 Tax=Mangrovivirga halotolerans TaxID=2993936 RepID=A0ABT3RVW1_9BACT|nr:hypothetical protein [Mangrovivirga halotolerans]MCX2745372.1 hypothetical protein [Mangrovivirga halotolerans]